MTPAAPASADPTGLPLLRDALLRSYSQVLFSRSRLVGAVLLGATFLAPAVGLSGLVAAALALGLGLALRLPRTDLREGLYGYNAMLVGLGVGALFVAGPAAAALLVLGVGAAVLGTAAARSMLSDVLALPVLTVPFVVVLWLLVAAGRRLGLSRTLVDAEPFVHALGPADAAASLLQSLGALFFLPVTLGGAAVLLAMLVASRIGTSLALGGFAVAWGVGGLLIDPAHASLHLTLGFNLALVAWGLGGVWFVPGGAASLLGLGAAAVTGLVTVGLAPLFTFLDLPLGILPFNLVVLGTLLAMRQRSRDGAPRAVDFLPGSPEENLHHHRTRVARFGSLYGIRLHPPFLGAWTVTQGEDGAHTHRGDWRSAFDFEVLGPDGQPHERDGATNADHRCWRLPVLAPAPGTVVHAVDGLPDTEVGEMDLHDSWGNAVVVQHGVGLFSVVAHLARGSVRVRPGQVVQRGEELGRCGASGRSPRPHLHYQLQGSAALGAPTLTTELHDVVEVRDDGEAVLHGTLRPAEGTTLRAVAVDDAVARLLRLPPGQSLTVEVRGPGGATRTEALVTEVGLRGDRRLRSPRLDATLFYDPGDRLFTVLDATGPRLSAVHLLRAALPRVPYELSPRLRWRDTLPRTLLRSPATAWLLDVAVPFLPDGGVAMVYRGRIAAAAAPADLRHPAGLQAGDAVVVGESERRAPAPDGDAPVLSTVAVLRPGVGILSVAVTARGRTTSAHRLPAASSSPPASASESR